MASRQGEKQSNENTVEEQTPAEKKRLAAADDAGPAPVSDEQRDESDIFFEVSPSMLIPAIPDDVRQKTVTQLVTAAALAYRKNGLFSDFEDFLSKTDGLKWNARTKQFDAFTYAGLDNLLTEIRVRTEAQKEQEEEARADEEENERATSGAAVNRGLVVRKLPDRSAANHEKCLLR